jgi:hypothetical protein
VDQAILVGAGQKLIGLMDDKGIGPRAAVWVYNPDTDNWRLWIVPPAEIHDQREFYRRTAEIVAFNGDELAGLDTGDVEMVREDHPAIVALKGMFRSVGGAIQLSNNTLNGFYLPDGIILRMNLQCETVAP